MAIPRSKFSIFLGFPLMTEQNGVKEKKKKWFGKGVRTSVDVVVSVVEASLAKYW